ncbi:MAG: hypothetical protein LBN95_04275 [Prevotellaceae bacterium]|jgi:RHS repeat-associated protein|nr:hypothetical protein [Prevotellaceae bacterium]
MKTTFQKYTIIMMVAVAMLSCGKPSASIGNMKFASNNEQIVENKQDKNEIQQAKLDSFVIVPQIAVAQNKPATQSAGTFYLPVNEQFQYIREGANTDMAFEFYLPENLTENDSVVLTYQLNGVQDFTSLIKKINNSDVVGGKFLKTDTTWYAQTEELPYFALKKGKNIIRYQLPDGVHNLVGIKDMQLQVIPKIKNDNGYIVVNQPNNRAFYRAFGYLQGFVNDDAVLKIDNKEVKTKGGFFETIVSRKSPTPNPSPQGEGSGDVWTSKIEVEYLNGTKVEREVTFTNSIDYDFETGLNYVAKSTKQDITPENEFEISLLGAKFFGNKNSVLENKTLSITALRSIDMAVVSSDIFNVTAESAGYRFLPDGQKFENQQVIALKYDTALIENGYTADDIFTFYYDENSQNWQRIERDSIDLANCVIYSHTDHFTDYINGILKAPELPDVQAYTPTMIKDLQAAHPHTGIGQFSVPEANNKGTANTSMPLWLPAGRNGMQPNLSLSYSSGGGNGWLGQGWDIPFSSIEVETRWGVPLYSETQETETYLLDGETLVTSYTSGGNIFLNKPAYRRNFENRNSNPKTFYRRVEGQFQNVVRYGVSGKPYNYFWEVTDKDGVKYVYGKKTNEGYPEPTAVLTDETSKHNIAKWYLTRMEDTDGNYVEFSYQKKTHNHGQQVYLKEIRYTNKNTANGVYFIKFNIATKIQPNGYAEADTIRPDITTNARKGLLETDAWLLDNISVIYNDGTLIDTLRQYYFEYKLGEYGKTVLSKMIDITDAQFSEDFEYSPTNKNVFHRICDCCDANLYTFNYHNIDTTISKFSNKIDTVNVGNDNYMPFIANFNTATQGGSLGSSYSSSGSIGGTLAAGFGPAAWWKTLTIGGSYNYNGDENSSLLVMADLNGDGYPDKLFKDKNDNGKLKYRLQYFDTLNNKYRFEEQPHSVNNVIKDFNTSKSYSNNFGLELQFGVSAGFDWSKSHGNTYIYLADVNGDGLVDIVDGEHNKVYYNRLNNGFPTFEDKTQNDTIWVSGATCDDDVVRIDGEVDEEIFRYSYTDTVYYDSCHIEILPEMEDCNLCYVFKYDTILIQRQNINDTTFIINGVEYFYNEQLGCFISVKKTVPHDTICNAFAINSKDYAYIQRSIVSVLNSSLYEHNKSHLHYDTICEQKFKLVDRSINPLYAPNIEAVRAWIAPYKGTVSISSSNGVFLTDSLNYYRHKYKVLDGVNVSIQKNSELLLKNVIELSNSNNLNPVIQMNTTKEVNAGDIIYFRIESNNRHALDIVSWNPIIQYNGTQTIYANNNSVLNTAYNSDPQNFYFNAKNDFLINGNTQNLKMPLNGNIKIETKIKYPILKEPLEFVQRLGRAVFPFQSVTPINLDNYINSTNDSVVYTNTSNAILVHQGDSMNFILQCAGQVDWTKVEAQVTVYYIDATENGQPLQVIDVYSIPNETVYTISFNPIIGKQTYHYAKIPSQKVNLNIANTGIKYFYPSSLSTISGNFTDTIKMTVKNANGTLLAKGKFKKQSGSSNFDVIEPCSVAATINLSGDFYFDYYIKDSVADSKISSLVTNIKDANNAVLATNKASGLYSNYWNNNKKFQNIYRSWTQFGYKPKNSALETIDIDLLNLDYMSAKPDSNLLKANFPQNDTDPSANEDAINNFKNMHPEDNVEGGFNPLSGNFFIMQPNYKTNRYTAYTELVSISKDTMSNCLMSNNIEETINRVQAEGLPIPYVEQGEKVKTISKKTSTEPFAVRVGAIVVGYSYTDSKTTVESDYMDLNGDRYPDIVAMKEVQFSKPQGGLGSKKMNIDGIDEANNEGHSFSANTSAVAAVRDLKSNAKSGKSVNKNSSNGSIGGSLAGGQDDAQSTWMDINGDGLPDKVYKNGTARLNLGYRLSDYTVNFQTGGKLRQSRNFSAGQNIGGNLDFDLAYSISGGLGSSSGHNFSKIMYMDVNADGLPDKVRYTNSPLGSFIDGLETAAPNGISANGVTAIMNNDEKLEVAYNTGNGFSNWTTLLGNNGSMGAQINYGNSYNFSINGAVTAGFTILAWLKITATISGNVGWSVTADKAQLMDFNNDGFPDMVTVGNDNNLFVRYAIPQKANLLKTIQTPIGLETSIDYELSKYSTPDNPNRNWEMSQCKLKDRSNIVYKNMSQTTKFEYENRQYNRFEREDIGYETVRTKYINNDTVDWISEFQNAPDNIILINFPEETSNVQRIIEDKYNNKDYLFKGLKVSSTIKNANNQIFTKQKFNYKLANISNGEFINASNAHCLGSGYPVLEADSVFYYEKHTTPQIITAEQYKYSKYGNISKCTYWNDINDPNDNSYIDTIIYHSPTAYIKNVVKEMRYHSAGTNYVKKSEIDVKGHITKITRGANCITDYMFDTYGNITKVTFPADNAGNRDFHIIAYDNKLHALPISVKNSLNYKDSTVYDYRFANKIKTIDQTGSEMVYTYDSKNRLKSIKTPKDPVYTVKYDYSGNSCNAKTVKTNHYNADNPSQPIEIITVADALGRTTILKDAVIDGVDTVVVTDINWYDYLGQPIFKANPIILFSVTNIGGTPKYENLHFNNIYNQPFTQIKYDEWGRETLTILPDSTTVKTAYSFAADSTGVLRFLTTKTDANGNTAKIYTDTRELQTQITSPLGAVTQFFYDGLGQLLQSKDPENHRTYFQYDDLGRKTRVEHPSRGISTWSYDGATEQVKQENNPLGSILYYYDEIGRPKKISYSYDNINDVQYRYGAPNTGYQSGRLIKLQDATGVSEYEYDDVGNVVKQTKMHILPIGSWLTHRTEWEYDSWGRAKLIKYPDGEEVYYRYDNAGMLQSVSSSTNHNYINDIHYNLMEYKDSISYGNGTAAKYVYNDTMWRMTDSYLYNAAGGEAFHKTYSYDNIGNIVTLKDSLKDAGVNINHNFQYDKDNRLGYANSNHYNMKIAYYKDGRIRHKDITSNVVTNSPTPYTNTFTNAYLYEQADNPLAVSSLQGTNDTYLLWDNAGNLCYTENKNNQLQHLYWTIDNRMQGYYNSGKTAAFYRYSASGERELKITGKMENIGVMGHDYYFPVYNTATLYASNLLTVDYDGSSTKYYKHYFMESERILSNVVVEMQQDTSPREYLIDPATEIKSIFDNTEQLSKKFTNFATDYFVERSSGKNACTESNIVERAKWNIKDLGEKFSEILNSAAPDKPYYFHPDHLGGGSMVTDENGAYYQALAYCPFGEDLVSKKATAGSSYNLPYQFTGKEKDDESGFNYFGARYYWSIGGIFISVDNLFHLEPHLSNYAYCANNPLRYADPDGNTKGDRIVGLIIGVVTNVIPGASLLPIRSSYTPTNAGDYNSSLQTVDNTMLALGTGMMQKGSKVAAGGGTVAVTALAITGASGGTLTIAGVPVAAAGATVAEAGFLVATGGAVLASNASVNASKGYNYGTNKNGTSTNKNYKSTNQLQKDIDTGKAPNSLKRFDTGKIKGEQDHVHFKDGSALNKNGSWKHGGRKLTNNEIKYLKDNGWKIPD